MNSQQPRGSGRTLGQRIHIRRIELNLSQLELADMAGISPSNLCKIERGQHGPALATLMKLAPALQVDIAELLREESRIA